MNHHQNIEQTSSNIKIVVLIIASELIFPWIEIFGFRVKSLLLFALLAVLFMNISITTKNLKSLIKSPAIFNIIIIYLIISVLLTNIYNGYGGLDVIRFFSFTLPAFLFIFYIRDKHSLEQVLFWVLLFLLFNTVFEVIQIIGGEKFIPYKHMPDFLIAKIGKSFSFYERKRMPGLSLNGLSLGYIFVIFLPLVTAFINYYFSRSIIKYILITFLFIGVLMTYTRTAIFFSIGASLIIIFLYNRSSKVILTLSVPLILWLLMSVFSQTADVNATRFSKEGFIHNLKNRIGLALYGIEIGKSRNFWLGNKKIEIADPIFHEKFANFKAYHIPFLGKTRPVTIDLPHNIIADTLIKYGFTFLIGFVLLMVYLLNILRKLLLRPSSDLRYISLAMVFCFFNFIANGLFHNVCITTDFNFWILVGLLMATYVIDSEAQSKT